MGKPKSEAGFMEYLLGKDNLTRGELNKRFRSYLYNSILESESNTLSRYVSVGNRRTKDKPLTIDMLSKSLFTCFLFQKPVADNMATEAYKRDTEMENMENMMNVFVDGALEQWDPNVSRQSNDVQRRLERIFSSKSMMAWSEILRDAMCAKLEIYDSDEKLRPFYRVFDEHQERHIRETVERLLSWKMWEMPVNDDIDRRLSDNKSAVKDYFRNKGLTTGYLMGAPE